MSSLSEIYDKIVQSEIYIIYYKGSMNAIRVKRYDYESDEFKYIDVKLKTVSSIPILSHFINKYVHKFKRKEYLGDGDMIYTQEELNGEYISPEISDGDEILSIVAPLIMLYERGYLDADSTD